MQQKQQRHLSFNTQPPEGGWISQIQKFTGIRKVSTHSRPKAAGPSCCTRQTAGLFQHTAARRRLDLEADGVGVVDLFQHTAARRRLDGVVGLGNDKPLFQHTAARRRLALHAGSPLRYRKVSTHSRPKAAGTSRFSGRPQHQVSTHSRPKAAG